MMENLNAIIYELETELVGLEQEMNPVFPHNIPEDMLDGVLQDIRRARRAVPRVQVALEEAQILWWLHIFFD